MPKAVIVCVAKSGGYRVMREQEWTRPETLQGYTGSIDPISVDRWPGHEYVEAWDIPREVATALDQEIQRFRGFAAIEAAKQWLREQGGKPEDEEHPNN